ncbi:MAG: transposase [Nitrospirae bacterium]|nr:transposase [Nitrospirota bacterium]
MARPLRIEYSGAVYHITSRGNERKHIFWTDDDRSVFLRILQAVTVRFHWLCHAYCLMDNHYHLIVETPDGNLSAGMRQLNGVYTQSYNRMHERVGHVFQGRYKAILVQKESHLLEACRYVVLNPVRAKAIKAPEEWKWSSYRATAAMEKPQECVIVEWVLGQFDGDSSVAAIKYQEFVHAGIAQESMWEKVRGQALLGDEGFAEICGRHLKDKRLIGEIPRGQRYADRPSLDELFAKATDIIQRNNLICEAIERHGYRQSEVAAFLGIHYSTISKITANSSPKT